MFNFQQRPTDSRTGRSPAAIPAACLAAIVAAFAASPLPAQARQSAVSSPPQPLPANSGVAAESLSATLQHTVLFDEPGDGAIWARGLTYKASFESGRESDQVASRFTYIPFLGATAPRNVPVRFTIQHVSIGGAAVMFDAHALPRREGTSVVFDRGRFIERYDLRPQSVEQTFVLAQRPQGAGELLVRIAIDSDLTAAVNPNDVAIRFSNERGGITYTHAVLVDAGGVRTPLSTAWAADSRSIDIRVPGEALRRAAYPIVIDPVIATFSVENTSQNAFNADVAFDVPSGSYGFAYEVAFSSTDSDVYVRRYSWPNFAHDGTPITIDFTGASWERPRIAGKSDNANFLVVAQAGVAPNRAIWGRVCTAIASGTLTSAQFEISSPATTGEKINPDVGGDPIGGGVSNWLVVWERSFSGTDHDIHARIVTDEPTGALGSTIFIDNSGIFDATPAVSAYNGGVAWCVAWERTAGANLGDIYCAYLNRAGGITLNTIAVRADNIDCKNPSVSMPTTGGVHAIAFEDGPSDVSVSLMQGAANIGGSTLAQLGSDSGGTQFQPTIETDGQKFIISWTECSPPPFGDCDVWMQAACMRTQQFVSWLIPAEPRQGVATSPLDQFDGRVATRGNGVFADSDRKNMVVWGELFLGDVVAKAHRSPFSCCPADVAPAANSGDGLINIDDLVLVITHWGSTNSPADITGDGVVNIDDLVRVITAWGNCQ